MSRKHNPAATHAKVLRDIAKLAPAVSHDIKEGRLAPYSARPTWCIKGGRRRRRWHWSLVRKAKGYVLAKLSGRGEVLTLYVRAGSLKVRSIVEYDTEHRHEGGRILDQFERVYVD